MIHAWIVSGVEEGRVVVRDRVEPNSITPVEREREK